MIMRGSDAAERHGVVWTLSHEDHPVGVLEKDFNRLDSGKISAVSISMSEKQRTHIMSEICVERDIAFEESFGVNFTKLNCDNVYHDSFYKMTQNCSLLPYYGWKNEDNIRPCSPRDLIQITEKATDNQPEFNDDGNSAD